MLEKIETSFVNHINIVTDNIPGSRSVSLGFWIEYGTRDEPDGKTGLAHFLEHMLFKGTSKYSAYEIVRQVEMLGGVLNAFTGKELICIHVEILDEAFEKVFDILSDMLLFSEFSSEEIEKEKQVVFEEIAGVHDVPEELIEDKFSELLFKGNTLSKAILGEKETVAAILKADLEQTMASILKERGLTITAAGNISHLKLVKLLEDKFKIERDLKKIVYQSNVKIVKNRIHFNKPFMQTHITIGMPVCGYVSPERYYVYLLHFLLGAGMSSTLFQKVREEKSLAYHLYSYYEFYRETGMFNIYLCTDKSKKDGALSIVEREFEKLRLNGISLIKLEELKSQLKGQMALKLERIPNRMLNMGRQMIYNQNVESLDDVLKSIDKISLNEMNNFLKGNLYPEKMMTLIMGK